MTDEQNPLACLHFNRGSADAAAEAYENEYLIWRTLEGGADQWPTLWGAKWRELHAFGRALLAARAALDKTTPSTPPEAKESA